MLGHLGVFGEEAAQGGGGTSWGGVVFAAEQVGGQTEDLGTENAGGAVFASMPKTVTPEEMNTIGDRFGSLHALATQREYTICCTSSHTGALLNFMSIESTPITYLFAHPPLASHME